MGVYVPWGWPKAVPTPDTDGWVDSAVAWLFDVIPPRYRDEPVLRDNPVVLVHVARHHVRACLEGCRAGYRVVRTELSGILPPHTVVAVLDTYRKEGHRLEAAARAVDLIGRAMRGEAFTPKH